MKLELECPFCNEKIFSDIGNGCKMCGMPLEYDYEDFCSDICMEKYQKINKKKIHNI